MALSRTPGFGCSANPRLSALRVNDERQFLSIVEKAIELNYGIVKNAAFALRVHRNTMIKWINHYPSLQIAVEKARVNASLEDK